MLPNYPHESSCVSRRRSRDSAMVKRGKHCSVGNHFVRIYAFIVAFVNDAIGVIIRRSVSIFLELTVGGTTWRF